MVTPLSSNALSSSLHTSTADSIGTNRDPEDATLDGIRGLPVTVTSSCHRPTAIVAQGQPLSVTPIHSSVSSYVQVQTPTDSNRDASTHFFSSLSIFHEEEAKEEVEQAHRMRFMSDTERVLTAHPYESGRSFREMEASDPWHLQPLDVVLSTLDVTMSRGLFTDQVTKRMALYGPNALEGDKPTPIMVVFLLQFMNLIIGLLLAAAVAAMALQEWVEGLGIVVIVTLNAVVATIQEKNAGDALHALQKMASPKCVVVREGCHTVVTSDELVQGDIVLLTTGDVVPADLRLVQSVDLTVNEMILTGESEDVSKKHDAMPSLSQESDHLTASNMVFASTAVATGNAVGVVVETGMHTRVGAIATLLKGNNGHDAHGKKKKKNIVSRFMQKYQPKLTPLQESLHQLGVVMGMVVVMICLVVFAVGMIRGDVDPKHPDRPLWLYMVMVAVSLAVSAVPEGLPMVVTICLSTGTADMVKKHVLVRKLVAVESLGASSVICTDKTGTLTEGKMTAVKMWGDNIEYTITGTGFEPIGDIVCNGVSQTTSNAQVRATLLSAALCSNTKLQQETLEDGSVTWTPRGNSSEAPLVVAAAKAGMWCDQLEGVFTRVTEIPFSSDRKLMITVNRVPSLHGSPSFEHLSLPPSTTFVANVKGAPNYIIEKCSQYVCSDGSVFPLESCDVDNVLAAVDKLSSEALRVLAVAIRPMAVLPYDEADEVHHKFETLCNEPWIFVGLIASMDPPRQGVKESIEQARNASIRTVMITGDYHKTAVAIAKTIELLHDTADAETHAVDCTTLRPHGIYLNNHALDEITSRCSVFARAKPEDKIEIVKSLQRQGHVSAMTGDGVNDAPALKESDIGVAMGIAGTAVAQRLSDMILTDDNFCSIVAAVEKGREIYANIQRFVCFLLSTNFGEITLIFVAIAVGMPTPLEPLQILVLNVFADGMAAVALSLEKGDGTVMQDRPRPRSQQIIHGRLWMIVLTNAFLIALGALIVYTTGLYWNFGHVLLKDIAGSIDPSNGGGLEYENAICSRWNGIDQGWQLYTNCASPNYRADGSMQCFDTTGYDCISEGVARAQTMTFVFITHMEMLRAYTARSFTKSIFNGLFANRYMQIAAIGMIILTLSVTNIPFVMDRVFGFAYIEWFQWLYAIAFALLMVTLGECLKWCYRCRDRKKVESQVPLVNAMQEVQQGHCVDNKLDVVIEMSQLDCTAEVVGSPRHSTTSASNSSESSKSASMDAPEAFS